MLSSTQLNALRTAQLLDIETGEERGRVRTGGVMQGVVFPSVGWGRDLYWNSMGRLARVFVN